MAAPGTGRGARCAWAVLVVVIVVSGVVALLPDLRSPVLLVAAPLSVVLVLVGMAVHRTLALTWALAATMLGLWACGTVVVQLTGQTTPLVMAVVGAGQAVSTALAALIAWSASRVIRQKGDRAPGSAGTGLLDLVIIGVVLALVGTQLVVAATASGGSSSTLVGPTVDVTIIGLLLRFAVSRRITNPSSWLALAAAALTVGYDLSSAVQGQRLALPGEAGQVLGTLCVLVFGVAALHPSMRTGLAGASFSVHRPASTSLLGLLPLVVVPIALWWVAARTGTQGLPAWVLLIGGAVVAALSLLRAAGALRATEHIADHDPLTELANRRGLERAFAREAPVGGRSLLLVDVDEFKQVNDTHGHDVGDALLVQVRDRLLAASAGAGLVARLGGDEFVLLARTRDARDVADRVLAGLREPVVLGDLSLRVSASIGIAEAEPAMTLPEVLTRADIAMYAVKAAGRDGVEVFDPQMRVDVARRFALTSEVRQLLGGSLGDVGHLEVHYQPLVDLRTGVPVGAEALVRWRHPGLGLLGPDEFLGIVGSSGLDVVLDTAVYLDVVATMARWRDEGRRVLPVSVNLTRDSLADPHLADRLLRVLGDAGLCTSLLHVEITEHQQLPADGPAAHTLAVLAEAGVGIHLDDYGTGYTSLDYLRRFPVELLKLDRSVVSTIEGANTQLVAAVAAMAATLRLDVLAEGVETTEQRDALVALGVKYGQGYLFSRPLPQDRYAHEVLGPPVQTPDPTPAPLLRLR